MFFIITFFCIQWRYFAQEFWPETINFTSIIFAEERTLHAEEIAAFPALFALAFSRIKASHNFLSMGMPGPNSL